MRLNYVCLAESDRQRAWLGVLLAMITQLPFALEPAEITQLLQHTELPAFPAMDPPVWSLVPYPRRCPFQIAHALNAGLFSGDCGFRLHE